MRKMQQAVALAILSLSGLGCSSYPFLPGGATSAQSAVGGLLAQAPAYQEFELDARTFVNPMAVTTVSYRAGDTTRTPFLIDFNDDGKVDPVVSYGQNSEDVWQILLSQGDIGVVRYLSLTLDRKQRAELLDTAVGDIDGDGALDLIGASEAGLIYLHNPGPGRETELREWGSEDFDDEPLENTTAVLTTDEINDIIIQFLPPGTNLDNYDVTVEQGYSSVEIGDMDNDGDQDVVASRRFKLTLTPKPDVNLQPLAIISGELQVLLNPGLGTTTGAAWELVSVGRHERATDLDRDGVFGLSLFDLDGDGDLDIVSVARDDGNAQVAWFENPGPADFPSLLAWTQWRIGSVREAQHFDLLDITGDGRVDVVANGTTQMQTVLFVQPAGGPKRDYDWDTFALVTYESFQPLDVKLFDYDGDGRPEIVVGGTQGAVRIFNPTGDPRQPWAGTVVANLVPAGNVGLMAYGDADGDGDLDLFCVLDDDTEDGDVGDRIIWIQNNN